MKSSLKQKIYLCLSAVIVSLSFGSTAMADEMISCRLKIYDKATSSREAKVIYDYTRDLKLSARKTSEARGAVTHFRNAGLAGMRFDLMELEERSEIFLRVADYETRRVYTGWDDVRNGSRFDYRVCASKARCTSYQVRIRCHR